MIVRPRIAIRLPFRRSLFTFPDLSSFSPFSSSNGNLNDPQTYHERKILPYKPSELYNVVADVASYPSFIPFCTGSRILRQLPHVIQDGSSPESSTMEAELTVGFLAFQESYVSTVSCKQNTSVEAVASSSTPLFKTLSTAWRFQPALPQSLHSSSSSPLLRTSSSTVLPTTTQPDNGPTLVTLDLAFAFANPVHAAVSAAFFGQVSKMMVKAFEERCIDVYGPGTT